MKQLHRNLKGGSSRIDLQLDEGTAEPLPEGAEVITVYARGQHVPAQHLAEPTRLGKGSHWLEWP
jgi:hypothetical protein